MQIVRNTSLRELELAECFDLLATVTHGRLAISYQALPAIVPVHMEFAGREIVLSSMLGESVYIVAPNVVALEAGNLGENRSREWTVQVCGMLRAVDHEPERPLGSNADPLHDRFRMTTDQVRGWTKA